MYFYPIIKLIGKFSVRKIFLNIMSEISESTPLNKDKTSTSDYLTVNPENDNEVLSIYNETDVLFVVKDDSQSNTLKDRIGHMLNSTQWNISILLMIACDTFLVVLELFIQLDEQKQCNPDNKPQSYDHDLIASIVNDFGFLSDIFLCIFTMEVFLHLYCFGFKYLLEAWINFIDSITVIITFIVTILITFYAAGDKSQRLVDILIVLRFWRIFCLVESVVNATQLEANLRFKEVLIDLNAEVRILENRKNCYAEKLTELGYDLSQLENDYLFPKIENQRQRKLIKENTTSNIIDELVLNVTSDVKKAK